MATILSLPLAQTPQRQPDQGDLIRAALDPQACFRPLYGSRVSAGFPSPAEDYLEGSLDLNEYLIRNKAATFFFRVQGDSMDPRIHDGDLLVVDRAVTPKHNFIVLAVVDSEYTVKRLYRRGDVIELRAENPRYQPIGFAGEETLTIWGVVVGTVCRIEGHG